MSGTPLKSLQNIAEYFPFREGVLSRAFDTEFTFEGSCGEESEFGGDDGDSEDEEVQRDGITSEEGEFGSPTSEVEEKEEEDREIVTVQKKQDPEARERDPVVRSEEEQEEDQEETREPRGPAAKEKSRAEELDDVEFEEVYFGDGHDKE